MGAGMGSGAGTGTGAGTGAGTGTGTGAGAGAGTGAGTNMVFARHQARIPMGAVVLFSMELEHRSCTGPEPVPVAKASRLERRLAQEQTRHDKGCPDIGEARHSCRESRQDTDKESYCPRRVPLLPPDLYQHAAAHGNETSRLRESMIDFADLTRRSHTRARPPSGFGGACDPIRAAVLLTRLIQRTTSPMQGARVLAQVSPADKDSLGSLDWQVPGELARMSRPCAGHEHGGQRNAVTDRLSPPYRRSRERHTRGPAVFLTFRRTRHPSLY